MSIDDEARPVYREAARQLAEMARKAVAEGACVIKITHLDCARRGNADTTPAALQVARSRGTIRGAATVSARKRHAKSGGE